MDPDNDLITLDEAAKMIPGADANTLKRMCRKGVLICYKPGKAYLTTRAKVREAVEMSRVGQGAPARPARPEPPLPLGLTRMELANQALNTLLNTPPKRKKRASP